MILEIKKASHRAHRNASQGAGITLVCGCGEYVATFDCATRCTEILGNRGLHELGDGLDEIIPCYKIPLSEIASALAKLSARYSVALIDVDCARHGTKFELVWKIPVAAPTAAKLTTPHDDFL
jgi:hypothetical protein